MKDKTAYDKALKLLGLKKGASVKEIQLAYRSLAKRYHPDLNNNPDAPKKFIPLMKAKDILLKGPSADMTKFANFKNVYYKMKSKIPKGSVDPGDLEEARNDLIKNQKFYEDPKNMDKLEAATNVIQEEISLLQKFRSKFKGYRAKHAREMLLPEEQRQQLKIQRMNEKLNRKAELNKFKKDMKKKFPVLLNVDGKKVLKWSLITAGLLAAIASGKYYYDSRTKVFKPKALITEGKK